MLTKIVTVALLSGLALAGPEVEKRAPQATSPQDFTSAVSQLVSLYVPSSVATPVGLAIISAAAANGVTVTNPQAFVLSALAAPTPPPFLTAIPSQYSANIASLESAISNLRGVASTGIVGAPVVTTNSAGSTVTSIKGAVVTTDSKGSTLTGLTGTSGVTSTLSSSPKTSGTASTTVTSTGTATTTAGGSNAPSSSKGAGVPMALAPGAGGILGLIGLVLAL